MHFVFPAVKTFAVLFSLKSDYMLHQIFFSFLFLSLLDAICVSVWPNVGKCKRFTLITWPFRLLFVSSTNRSSWYIAQNKKQKEAKKRERKILSAFYLWAIQTAIKHSFSFLFHALTLCKLYINAQANRNDGKKMNEHWNRRNKKHEKN